MASGVYNVVDDEPVSHEVFVGSLADAIGVPHPKLPRPWMTRLFGSTGELLARSERISNKKLRTTSGWTPRYPSVREGWRSVAEGLKGRPGLPNPVALDKTHN
jgi:NAD dependent epimerase/dehydratase family enzyme